MYQCEVAIYDTASYERVYNGGVGCIKVKLLPMIVPHVNVSNVYYRDVYEF